MDKLRNGISDCLNFKTPVRVPRTVLLKTSETRRYTRQLISYKGSEKDEIRAFLYIPKGFSNVPGILIHHQHNSEFNVGKSEPAGIAGSKYQAFAPVFAEMGYAVLVPDRITFEDRRVNAKGTRAHKDDWLQHYNGFSYRLLKGQSLTAKILDDSSLALNLLAARKEVDAEKLMVFGHSDGGNNALLQSALDPRVAYCCASGSVCSYENKIRNQTGISMMLLIPEFMMKYEMQDLVKCVAPRDLLIVSAEKDKYSADADRIYAGCKAMWEKNADRIQHLRYNGGHALDAKRFRDIVRWVSGVLA